MQSGSAINPWSVGHTDVQTLSNLVGLSRPDERELLKALQALPVKDVLRLQQKLRDVRQTFALFHCSSVDNCSLLA